MSLILSPTALLGTLTSALGSSASASSGSKFQDLLQQAQAAAASGSDSSDGTGNGVSGSSGSTGSASGSHLSRAERRQKEDEARLAQARQDLADYMSKSPAEHMREAILKEMGLTEDDLKAMPPEKRAAVEADIDRRIKERLLAENKSPSEFDVQQMSAAALLAEKIKNARSTNAAGNQSATGSGTGSSGTNASPAISML
ncbi:hypothetical protein [Azospira inquinata]|uniref:Secreted protein n=1 Tax=Azospira inquinata TaxID=2785627 RepID=A0A975XVD7_9RHOO|nr:hypothetical protein [Azospira inquinata]QWT44925.1 hypothetical protein J8L76_08100 [Azospira inquinata]QWT49743.1 hypothetical protein Azoinq_03780 [Azospira inquinata]